MCNSQRWFIKFDSRTVHEALYFKIFYFILLFLKQSIFMTFNFLSTWKHCYFITFTLFTSQF